MPNKIHIDQDLRLALDSKELAAEKQKMSTSLQALDLLQNELYSGTCDLHIHTLASDGTETCSYIMQKVIQHKLRAFSITDSDTMDGIDEMEVIVSKLLKLGIKVPNFIRGIQLSLALHPSTFSQEPIEGHLDEERLRILAYFPLGYGEELNHYLESQRQKREARNREICQRLQDLGMAIRYEEVLATGSYILGRSHIASVLARKGYATNKLDALHLWLMQGKEAYVPYQSPSVEEGLQVIREAGGVPVISFVSLYKWLNMPWDVQKKRCAYLKEKGMLGLQAVHGHAKEKDIIHLIQLAKELGLTVFSGSGYRGYNDSAVDIFRSEMDFSRFIF